jgi:beta-lactam-binding protein with PASTA domain
MSFLKNHKILTNISIAILVFVSLYFILIFSLSSYTLHGETIVVPNLTELTFVDAKELATKNQLNIKIIDTVFSSKEKRGLIANQIPKANSRIKKDRTIYLTINAITAEKISMPNLIGTSLRQAIVDAQIYGIKIGELSYIPDIAKNNVLKQQINGKNIPVGAKIEKGTSIDLVLGMGLSNEKVFIPLLIGEKINKVDSLLTSKYLNIGAKFYDVNILTKEDSLAALVYKQRPNPFSKNFKPGDFVDIWLTRDSAKIIIKEAWKDSLNVFKDTLSL